MSPSLPAIEYLEKLPEPIKSEALQAAEDQQLETRFETVETVSGALAISFLWENTKQGRLYWLEVSYKSLFN